MDYEALHERISKRAIYYCSRMVSSQYGTEFTNSHYEKIKKVYSIWICINPPKHRENSITEYSITEKNLFGKDVDIMCNLSDGVERKGFQKGIDSINALNMLLLNANRIDDLKRAAMDKEYQVQLMKELLPQEVTL